MTLQHVPSEVLSAYLDDQISPAEQRDVSAHLGTCDACSTEVAELRATVKLLNGLPEFSPRRSFALDESHTRPPRTINPALRLLPVVRALSVAAILVFMISGSARLIDVASDNDDGPTTSLNATGGGGSETNVDDQTSEEQGNKDGQNGSFVERGNAAAANDENIAVYPTEAPDTVAQTGPGRASSVGADTSVQDGQGRSALATTSVIFGVLAVILAGSWFALVRLSRPESTRRT